MERVFKNHKLPGKLEPPSIKFKQEAGQKCRTKNKQFDPRPRFQPKDIVCSPKPPAKNYCALDMRSPIAQKKQWTSCDIGSPNVVDNIHWEGMRSPLRRTHSAPQDIVPNQPPRRQRAARRFSRPMIEVVPGTSMPLIGYAETKHYFRQGNCVRPTCLQCTLSLYCAMDASYMLCSVCESISPIRISEQDDPFLGFGVTLDQVSE